MMKHLLAFVLALCTSLACAQLPAPYCLYQEVRISDWTQDSVPIYPSHPVGGFLGIPAGQHINTYIPSGQGQSPWVQMALFERIAIQPGCPVFRYALLRRYNPNVP